MVLHYFLQSGKELTLRQIGYLSDIIDYYANNAIARDGTIGAYNAVEKQIIDKAKNIIDGNFTYYFEGNYNFQQGVLFSFGDSVISGYFVGSVRKENKFIIINGIITYNFNGLFGDPFDKVERLMERENISRTDAERIIGNSGNLIGAPYKITDTWQTKINATAKIY